MGYTSKFSYRIVLSICLLFLFINPIHAQKNRSTKPLSEKKVLLLNSYHEGYLWTDEITRGIQETLSNEGIDLHIEYMDTKRQFKYKLLHLLSDILKIKHKKHQYDIIISSDDNAFNFIKTWRENIFKDVPVVFCGVNYLEPKDLEGLIGYTGINEKMDILGNIELIKKIHPDKKKIVIITDNTTTGKQNQKEAIRIASMPENQHLDFELTYNISMEDLITKVRAFEKNTIVLFTIFIRDKNDRFLEYEDALTQVSEAISIPMYATQNFSAGLSIVGGYLTNGFDQGAAAGAKAIRILSGEPVSNVAVLWETPTHPRFDFQQLNRHGINTNQLPANSQIINKPASFYIQNKLVIKVTAIIFTLLIIAFLGVSYGFIKSKRAEREISESEKKYRQLFENAPSGMYEIDLVNRKFTNVNQIMCQLTGYSKDEFMALDFFELLSEESKILYSKRLDKISSGDSDIAKSVEYHMIRKDGQTRSIVLNLDFFSDAEKIVSARVVVHDITERKQVEELMVQSEKMMSIGGLAAGMAHEINNPLAGMMQNAQVIHNRLTKPLPANEQAAIESGTTMDSIKMFMEKRKILHQLENINTAGIRAARIVNNMLSFARKSNSEKQRNDIYKLMEETLDLAQSDYNLTKKYDFKRIDIIKEYAPGLPELYCEKSKIEQVLLNILKNSAEAMAAENSTDKPPILRLRLYKEQTHINIEIEDNGPGMEEKTSKHIFEPFFTTKSVDEGTGLGLSVSYFIVVDDHKGKMSVKSNLGKGTRFIIQLPIEP